MKKKDNEYTQLKIGDKVVNAKVNKLAVKDLTNFTSRLPPEYRVKSLAWGPDFLAAMEKSGFNMRITPSGEQQKIIDENYKRMNEFIAIFSESINAALREYILKFKMYPSNIEIKPICDNKVADKNYINFEIHVE